MNAVEKNPECFDFNLRMKKYERTTKFFLTPKQPVIVKVSGNKNYVGGRYHSVPEEPFTTAILKICSTTPNISSAFYHSGSVLFLLKDYESRGQVQLFNGDIQKINSAFASKLTLYFNFFNENSDTEFSCKCFNLPPHEVVNYFINFQNTRASKSKEDSVGVTKGIYFKKTIVDFEREDFTRNKWIPDYATPLFIENKNYIVV